MRTTDTLSAEKVARIKGMVRRGDRQVDVALLTGVSPATVNGIKRGTIKAHRHVEPEAADTLPPPGPYVIVSARVHDEAMAARRARDILVLELRRLISSYTMETGDHEDRHSRGASAGATSRADTVHRQ